MTASLTHDLFAAIMGRARTRDATLPTRWISAYGRLSTMVPLAMLAQNDYWVDLVLRDMEWELSERLKVQQPAEFGAFELANQFQQILTRMWLLSTYELIRIANASDAGKAHPKVATLYDRLRLVRIPMAKGEIAADKRLPADLELHPVGEGDPTPKPYIRGTSKNYIPPMFIRTDTGSIG